MHNSFAHRPIVLEISAVAERIWMMIHTDQGPIQICAWYRPPCAGEVESIASFKTEFANTAGGMIGTLVVGDLNVHNIRWLRHSTRNSNEGVALQCAAAELGLRQIVDSLTRGANLLDLVLTDLEKTSAVVLGCVADHAAVLSAVRLQIPKAQTINREVWLFQEADWARLQDTLQEDLRNNLKCADPDEAAKMFSTQFLPSAEECIDKKTLAVRKSTHPWLTEKALQAVAEKHNQEALRQL